MKNCLILSYYSLTARQWYNKEMQGYIAVNLMETLKFFFSDPYSNSQSYLIKMSDLESDNPDPAPPLSETVDLFIDERIEEIASKYDDEGKEGKWMLFYKEKYMDASWYFARKFYSQGRLRGITRMRTSTAAKDSSVPDNNFGVIRFYCGPSDNEHLMKRYGRNLVNVMKYYSRYGFVAYKSNEQSQEGTRFTGNRTNNYLYRIAVPKETKWVVW